MMEFLESQPDDQPTEILPRYFTNRIRFVIYYVADFIQMKFPVKNNLSMSEIILTESQTDDSSDQSSFIIYKGFKLYI